MIRMYNSEMTAGVITKIEERAGKKIDKLLKDELKQLMYEMKEEEEIEADADFYYVWLDEECKSLCRLPQQDYFSRVEELNIYVSSSEDNGDYDIYNGYNDFVDFYLGREYPIFSNEDNIAMFEERFQNNLKDIIWYDEDNELKRAVDEELNQIQNDEDREDLIKFVGNNITTLINEIAEYSHNDYEVKGYYSGKKIYRIKNRLYYLTDDSGTCNMDYFWFLQELGPKGYEYFGVKNPSNDDKNIEDNYHKNLIEKMIEDFIIGIIDCYGCSYESLEEQVKEIVRKEVGEFLEVENDEEYDEEYDEIKNSQFEPTIEEILTGILEDKRICFFEARLYTHNNFAENLNLDYVCGNEFDNPFEAIDARYREIYK